jgi:hypothetical protein
MAHFWREIQRKNLHKWGLAQVGPCKFADVHRPPYLPIY